MGLFSCAKKESTGSSQNQNNNEVTTSHRLFEAERELERAVKANDTRALRVVLFDNPDLSLNNYLDNGETLLTHAIKKKFGNVRSILLDRGAEPDLKTLEIDFAGFSPLMLAAHVGDQSAISSLLESRATLNLQDEYYGDTALHKAIKNGYDDAAKLLVRSGASLNIVNFAHETPLMTAKSLNREEIAIFLEGIVNLQDGAPTIAVFRQILLDADVVNYRKFISSHRDVLFEYSSINPIALVLDSPNELDAFEIVQSLLTIKISPNGPEDAETPPIIKATKLRRKNILELLVRHKANLNVIDSQNRPALHFAIERNDEEMVFFLLDNGADSKFEVMKNGRKVSFRGCRIANMVQRGLNTIDERDTNSRIQSRLGCRWPR